MALHSPFHARTAPLCTSYAWKQWSGYHAVNHFGETHLTEYWAFREACAVTDMTPLFQYEVEGRDAARMLSRNLARTQNHLPQVKPRPRRARPPGSSARRALPIG